MSHESNKKFLSEKIRHLKKKLFCRLPRREETQEVNLGNISVLCKLDNCEESIKFRYIQLVFNVIAYRTVNES